MSLIQKLLVTRNPKKLLLVPVVLSLLIVFGFLLPQPLTIPVKGATPGDWNHQTFWYEPWGKSGVHKGIDIFAAKGTALLASTHGVVIYNGK